MSTNSAIEWTEATWNPIAGCTPVSPGCLNCYAATMSYRLERMGQEKYRGLTVLHNGVRTFNGTINIDEGSLAIPLKRKKPTMYFVNSMSDLFHETVSFDYVDRVFAVMALCPQHQFQVLTKRPERMAEYTTQRAASTYVYTQMVFANVDRPMVTPTPSWPLPNVWLGCSPVNQQTLDEYDNHLRNVVAAIPFLSIEPILGPVVLTHVLGGPDAADDDLSVTDRHCVRCGCVWEDDAPHECPPGFRPRPKWVIVGGESGPDARPCDIAWIRRVIRDCKTAGVPCFVKQLGSKAYDGSRQSCSADKCMVHGHSWLGLKDKKGGDMGEWPEDLRVRQMPERAVVA